MSNTEQTPQADEITTDEDAMETCQDIQSTLNDVVNHVDGKDYKQAVEDCDIAQAAMEALHTYLESQAGKDE